MGRATDRPGSQPAFPGRVSARLPRVSAWERRRQDSHPRPDGRPQGPARTQSRSPRARVSAAGTQPPGGGEQRHRRGARAGPQPRPPDQRPTHTGDTGPWPGGGCAGQTRRRGPWAGCRRRPPSDCMARALALGTEAPGGRAARCEHRPSAPGPRPSAPRGLSTSARARAATLPSPAPCPVAPARLRSSRPGRRLRERCLWERRDCHDCPSLTAVPSRPPEV